MPLSRNTEPSIGPAATDEDMRPPEELQFLSPILSTCSCNLTAKAIGFSAHLFTTHAQELSYARLC